VGLENLRLASTRLIRKGDPRLVHRLNGRNDQGSQARGKYLWFNRLKDWKRCGKVR
jgi:formamidopyrimidine-DNA glycosylase